MDIQKIKEIIYNTVFWYKVVRYPKKWVVKPDDKFLILAPHPDDETIGCGGLIALYPKQCDVICLTDGRHCDKYDNITIDEIIKIRKKEFETVMIQSGVNSFKMLGIEDLKLSKAKPKLDLKWYTHILIPSPTDAHPDHIAVSKILKKYYKKYYKKVVYYEVWGAIAKPTHYLDISNVIEKKKINVNSYKSQVEFIDYFSRISGLNRYRGMRPRIDFAESFQFVKNK